MVYGDLLRQLFASFASRDETAFRAAALNIVREERAKNHRLLADDLEAALFATRNGSSQSSLKKSEKWADLPFDRERNFPLVDISYPDLEWDRLVLHPNTLRTLEQISEENQRRDVLADAGIKPSQRLLFYGPPGCGKSITARVLASSLDVPLATVRFDAVVSSYLGETAANLRRVFDFISNRSLVVLFDEFDAIGKDRDDPLEHGELKRVVNSLLQLMDATQSQSLLIAATNHELLLDSAVWRRFDAVVQFRLPTEQERLLLVRLFLRGFSGAFRAETVAKDLHGATGADIERVCIAAARSAVLGGRSTVGPTDFVGPLSELKERLQLEQRSGLRAKRKSSLRRRQSGWRES